MPKQTFFNLPPEKRDALINAVMAEFSRVPLCDASISNMIKDAGISRGSFYQYFEDKEDIFFYLLKEHAKTAKEKFNSILSKKKGDLFESFIEFFHYMLTNYQYQKYYRFLRNAFLNMNVKVENTLTHNIDENNYKNRLAETLELINTENLNISNEEEIFHIIKIFMAITNQNLIRSFVKELPYDEAVKNFKIQLSLLKKGIYK